MTCNNRRLANDRRLVNWNDSFPLRTNNNVVILHDRRIRCDRRTSGLEVSDSDISQEAFLRIFNTLHNKNKNPNIYIDDESVHNIKLDAFEGYYNHE